jgi:hypothetical protein
MQRWMWRLWLRGARLHKRLAGDWLAARDRLGQLLASWRRPRVTQRPLPPLPTLFVLEDRCMPGETLGGVFVSGLAQHLLSTAAQPAQISYFVAGSAGQSQQSVPAFGDGHGQQPAGIGQVIYLPQQDRTLRQVEQPADQDDPAARQRLTVPQPRPARHVKPGWRDGDVGRWRGWSRDQHTRGRRDGGTRSWRR